MTESYIVRIYRRDDESESQLLGTVENIELKGKQTFHNFDELRDLLRKKGATPNLSGATEGKKENDLP